MAGGVRTRTPKYHLIADALREQIRAGEFASGARLPAETAIAAAHGASVPTVRQAMAVLRAEGVIESRHGIGTFVRDTRRLQRRSRSRYGEARGRDGLLNDRFRHEITWAGLAVPPPYVADAMDLAGRVRVVVRRRRLYDEEGQLQELGASYLPRSFAEGTYLVRAQVVPKALFRCVEEITGHRYARAQDHWAARPATPLEADAFGLNRGAFVLHLIHVAHDERGVILEVSESVWPAERLAFFDEYEIPAHATEETALSDV